MITGGFFLNAVSVFLTFIFILTQAINMPIAWPLAKHGSDILKKKFEHDVETFTVVHHIKVYDFLLAYYYVLVS